MVTKSQKVRAALTPAQVETPTYTIASVASLRALSLDALVERAKKSVNTLASQDIELGKVVFIVAESKPEATVLKKHVRKTLGIELQPAPYKVASAFRMVGKGHGSVTEGQFDACQLRWLFTVSAVLNLMEKEQTPAEDVAAIREDIAKAVRARSKDTGAILKLIYDALKPEGDKATGEEEESGETEGKAPSDWKPIVRALRDYIDKGEGHTAEGFTMLGEMLGALRDMTAEKLATMTSAGAKVASPVKLAVAA